MADGLVPGMVTPQKAKIGQQLPQAPPTFVTPAGTATQSSQAAIIQKLLQAGAFVVGRLPNDNQPYLMPSSGVGLQPFQVVFGSAGTKLSDGTDQRAAGVSKSGTSSADGISDEAAVAASHLLAEESREAAEKKLAENSGSMTAFSTEVHATNDKNMTPVDQVSGFHLTS